MPLFQIFFGSLIQSSYSLYTWVPLGIPTRKVAAMRRKIDAVLNRWADDPHARPLLVRGARRVGKTYALKRLGRERFASSFAYCDFQTNLEQLNAVFDGPTDIERIVSDLSLLLRQDIKADTTLIAFDEIQLCEKALNSLRFFAQSPYRVIATGSQLGITMRDRTLPFPSDVDQLYLRPLDFEEYLWAVGEERREFRAFSHS